MKSSLSKLWRDMRQDLRRRLAMHFVSDRDYLPRLHHAKLGAWPDLEHPSGFDEKILCKMLRDHRPLLTLFADKLRVRDYVRRVASGLALPTLYWWSSPADSLPFDKLFVFGGRLRLIQVDRDRFTRHTQVLYDRDWRYGDGTVAALHGTPSERPRSLSLMIESAEALSAKVDFVRVDLYEIDGRVYFGELTSSPNKGLSPFRPRSLDRLLGDWLVLDDYSQAGGLRYDPDAFAEIGTIAAVR